MRIKAGVVLLLVFFFVSCKKKTKEPAILEDELVACINGPLKVETASGHTYTWCGKNADVIEWYFNGQLMATGSSFTPTFTVKGKHTIKSKGINETMSGEASLDVIYGEATRIVCKISAILPLAGNKKNYKAYLYNTRADWATDATNGQHRLALDSVTCRDTSNLGAVTHFAFFKNIYATGSTKFVSVEYQGPPQPYIRESNWYDTYSRTTGNVIIKNLDNTNDTCSTFIDRYTRWILSVKWRLMQVDTGQGLSTATACLSDDYIRFYADGTWQYFTGDDHCYPNEESSRGVFTTFPFLSEGTISVIQASQGPLKKRGPYAWELNSWFESRFYLNPSGMYIFVPDL